VRGIGVRLAQKNVPAFKRCRNAIFQKRTMPDESLKTKPEKLPKTKTELEALVLAELRAASQCGGAVHVTVVAYDDYRVGATWEVASCNPGTSAPEECERALCDIVSRLQQHFDIAP
jgi:hypothetical protein